MVKYREEIELDRSTISRIRNHGEKEVDNPPPQGSLLPSLPSPCKICGALVDPDPLQNYAIVKTRIN
jgi:hypothetical protein